jgi:hypothetical protein
MPPYLFTILIVATITLVNLVSSDAITITPEMPPALLELISELVLAAVAVVLLTTRRSWRTVGFRSLRRLKDFRLYWVPVLPLLPVVAAVVHGLSRMHTGEILAYLMLACVIGFVEEVFFRGLILQALASYGLWWAASISSIIFGLMHVLNLLYGADFLATLLQAAYAAAMGFGFAAVTLRTGAIWPVIVIHALTDFAGFVTAGSTLMTSMTATDTIVYALYFVVFLVYGIFMMRAVGRTQVRRTPDSSGSFPDARSSGRCRASSAVEVRDHGQTRHGDDGAHKGWDEGGGGRGSGGNVEYRMEDRGNQDTGPAMQVQPGQHE